MWIDLSKWVKDVKMLVAHANAHQKMLCGQSAFLQVGVAQWAHEQSGHGGRDGVMLDDIDIYS